MVSVFDRFKESVVRNQSALAGSGEAPTSISGGRSQGFSHVRRGSRLVVCY